MEQGAKAGPVIIPQEACKISTPLGVETWEKLLLEHPDRWFVGFILRGIEHGFRIAFHGEQESLRTRMKTMVSAAEYPTVVDGYLEEELSQHRIARVGPLEKAKELGIHCSPFGVIPKKNKVNKWRLILDLSSPEGCSVNDDIQKDLA